MLREQYQREIEEILARAEAEEGGTHSYILSIEDEKPVEPQRLSTREIIVACVLVIVTISVFAMAMIVAYSSCC